MEFHCNHWTKFHALHLLCPFLKGKIIWTRKNTLYNQCTLQTLNFFFITELNCSFSLLNSFFCQVLNSFFLIFFSSFESWFDITSISEIAEDIVAKEREQNILHMLHQVCFHCLKYVIFFQVATFPLNIILWHIIDNYIWPQMNIFTNTTVNIYLRASLFSKCEFLTVKIYLLRN